MKDVACPDMFPYSVWVYGMSMLSVNSFDVAAVWYWSLTVTSNVNALVESVKSLGSIVPIRLPASESVMPVGSDPDVTVYDNTLFGSSSTVSIDSILGIPAVSVPMMSGVEKLMPMLISPTTFMVNVLSENVLSPVATTLLALTVNV